MVKGIKKVKWYKDEDENQRQKELQAKQKLMKLKTFIFF